MLMLLTNVFCNLSFQYDSNSSCFSFKWIYNLLNVNISQETNKNNLEIALNKPKLKLLLESNAKKIDPSVSEFAKEDTLLHEFFLLLIEKIKNLKQISLDNYQELQNQSNAFYKTDNEKNSKQHKETLVDMNRLKNLILNILEKNFNFDKKDIDEIKITPGRIEDCDSLTFEFKENLHETFFVRIDLQSPFTWHFNVINGKSYITLGLQRMYDSQSFIHEFTHYFLLIDHKSTTSLIKEDPIIYREIVSILMENSPIKMSDLSTSLEYRKNSFSQETLYNMLISYYLKYGLKNNESQKEAVLSFFSGYTKDHLTNNLNENILSEYIELFGMSFFDFKVMQYFLGEVTSHYYYTHHNPSNISIKDFSSLFSELSFEKILQFLKVDLNSFVDWVFAEYLTLDFNNCSDIE